MYIFLLSVLGALIGWVVVWTVIYLFFHPQRQIHVFGICFEGILHRIHRELRGSLPSVFDSNEIEEVLNPIVDEKLSVFMDRVKEQIPMATPFLSGSMAETLKEQAREEFHKMIPEMTEHLVEMGMNKTKPKHVKYWIKKRCSRDLQSLYLIGIGLGALIGAFVGLIIFLVQVL